MKILLLCTGKPASQLISAIESAGHTYEVHDPRCLYLRVSQSENGYDQLYDGNPELDKPERLPAKSYDAVISRIGTNLPHGAAILRHLTENLGIYCPQSADGLETASNKLKTTQRLSFNGIRVPCTVYADNPAHIDFLIGKVGGLPAVAKLLQGSQGVGVFILETPLAANTALQSVYKLNAAIKIQSMIKADGKDIRAIVCGDSVLLAMQRTAGKGDFRANISRNGSGKKVELSEDEKRLCIEAGKAVGLEFAGVDLIRDENGRAYILEVNGNPGTKAIAITGVNYFTGLIAHVEKQTGKKSEVVTEKAKSSDAVGSNYKAENAALGRYRELIAQEKAGVLTDGTQIALLAWYRKNYGYRTW